METKVLAPTTRSVTEARAFALAAANRWRIDDVTREAISIVVSELVTNAVIHAEGPTNVVLKLMLGSGQVRVEVTDSRGDVRPRLREADRMATSGRGLGLVASLSQRWGVEVRSPTEKVVWCEVACDA